MHSDSSDADSDHCTRPIVMHMGSSRIRAGFAGDDCPDVYSDTVCTTDPTRGILCGTRARCSKESLRHPIDAGGFVGNWEDIEALWRDTFERDMRVAAEDHQVMLVDAPGWTWEQREKYAELMYETFRVPGFAMHGEAALALCCSGRTTGVVIDVGTHITHISCVHDGVIAESRNVRTGGEDVTNRLQALLAERGVVLDSSAARGAKEAVCRIAGPYQSTQQDAVQHTLPDGRCIDVGAERFDAAEVLFESDTGRTMDVLEDALNACEIDVRRDVVRRVVVSGATTLLPGYGDRVHDKVQSSFSHMTKSYITESPEREFLAWIGGSIVCSLSTHQDTWVTKAVYDEEGFPALRREMVRPLT